MSSLTKRNENEPKQNRKTLKTTRNKTAYIFIEQNETKLNGMKLFLEKRNEIKRNTFSLSNETKRNKNG